MASYNNDQQVALDYQTPAQAAAVQISNNNAFNASNASDMDAINAALASINLAPAGSSATAEAAGKVANATAVAQAIGGTVNGNQVVAPTAGGGGGGGAVVVPPNTITSAQQGAIDALVATFNAYGLGGDIAKAITSMVQQGYDANQITLIAEDPKSTNPLAVAYQARFPANAARIAQGLPVLSPADYLATEQSYRQVADAAGLASEFSSPQSIANLMAADVSPIEMQDRINAANTVIQNADPYVTQQLQQLYGLSTSDMVGHILDSTTAAPQILRQVNAAQLSAEAARQGVNIQTLGLTGGNLTGEQLASMGVTQSQAAQNFQTIATQEPGLQSIAGRYGTAYLPAGQVGQALQASTFGTTVGGQSAAQATQALNLLKTQETSAFSGSAGAATGSLGLRDTSGLS